MTQEATEAVRLRQKFKADRNAVFDAWLDEKRVARWGGGHRRAVAVRIDARVGGEFDNEYYDSEQDKTWKFRGMFREIERGRRLQFLFWWDGEDDRRVTPGVVTIDFREVGEETEVAIVHTGIESAEERELLQRKWNLDLERMRDTVERRLFGRLLRWQRFFS
jgi:uncharacterized protein YndB with AHSA1/START domain